MVIVTNFKRFPRTWGSQNKQGAAVEANTVATFWARRDADAVWLVNCDPSLTLKLALLLRLAPWLQVKLVAVDIVLRTPRSTKDVLLTSFKRRLFSRVDHFMHYFSDVRGYDRTFGIGADRSSFIPFKSNLRERLNLEKYSEGDYIVCFGRSLRDYDTFLDAVQQLPYQAVISKQDPAVLRIHGARFTRPLDALPSNLKMVDDDGSDEAQVRILKGAKIVVLPVLKTSMVASGISSCLNAMSLGKCVIGTEGPGMSDIFLKGEVLTVPPEDTQSLVAAMRMAWEDEDLRTRTADAGYRYATALGGEQDLYQRVIDRLAELYV